MAERAITFARSARRELERLERPIAARILDRIETLADDPRPPGSRKLHGRNAYWRLRVGDYRVLYSVDDEKRVIDIVAIGHRRDIYR